MAEAYTRRVLIIVPAADQARANAAALTYDPSGGQLTFTVPASANGAEPASHYLCHTLMRENVFTAVTALIAASFPGTLMLEVAGDVTQALADLSLDIISPNLA